ncbi:MAG: hypothetical protein WKG06_25415 [Segetibacter sp.]
MKQSTAYNKQFCTSGADLLTISIGVRFSNSSSDVTLLSDSNNNELLFINLATVTADVILLSRLRTAVPLCVMPFDSP